MTDDDDGQLVDLRDQYAAALAMIPSLWAEAVSAGRDPAGLTLDLTDAAGKRLLSVPFTDVLRRTLPLN